MTGDDPGPLPLVQPRVSVRIHREARAHPPAGVGSAERSHPAGGQAGAFEDIVGDVPDPAEHIAEDLALECAGVVGVDEGQIAAACSVGGGRTQRCDPVRRRVEYLRDLGAPEPFVPVVDDAHGDPLARNRAAHEHDSAVRGTADRLAAVRGAVHRQCQQRPVAGRRGGHRSAASRPRRVLPGAM